MPLLCCVGRCAFRYRKIMRHLQIHPKPGRRLKSAAKQNSSLCRNGALTIHNLGNPIRRNAKIPSKSASR